MGTTGQGAGEVRDLPPDHFGVARPRRRLASLVKGKTAMDRQHSIVTDKPTDTTSCTNSICCIGLPTRLMRADSFASENLTASVNDGSARRRGAAATGTGLATRGDDLVPRAARAGGGARGDDLSVWRRLRHRAPQVRARWRAPPRTGVCGGSRRREAWFEERGQRHVADVNVGERRAARDGARPPAGAGTGAPKA